MTEKEHFLHMLKRAQVPICPITPSMKSVGDMLYQDGVVGKLKKHGETFYVLVTNSFTFVEDQNLELAQL